MASEQERLARVVERVAVHIHPNKDLLEAAAFIRASAPPADVAQDAEHWRFFRDAVAYASKIDPFATGALAAGYVAKQADALAALAGERDRLREAVKTAEATCHCEACSLARWNARAALGGSDA